MKRFVLLSAAVMPQAGVYEIQDISEDDFFTQVSDAKSWASLGKCEFLHSLGYEQTVDFVNKRICDPPLAINRVSITLEDQDQLMILRLKMRTDPDQKGAVNMSFEYFRGEYHDAEIGIGAYHATIYPKSKEI